MKQFDNISLSSLSRLIFVVLECDSGWDEYQGFCYRLYPQASSASPYPQAQTTCESEGSHLVSITSAEEDDFVKIKQ